MSHVDGTEGLRRAAGPPASGRGPNQARCRHRRRRRRRLVGVAAAVVAVAGFAAAVALNLGSRESDAQPDAELPVAGHGSPPAPGTARLRVEQTFGGGSLYTEGSFGHVEVRDAATGSLAVDRRLFAAPTVVDAELDAGRYTLVSYQRPCQGTCWHPDTGAPVAGDPTDGCDTTFDVDAGEVADATVTVTPARGCHIDLQVVSAADAAQAACGADVVEIDVATASPRRVTTITAALRHGSDRACTLRTDLRVALTDGQGHLLPVDGNPAATRIDRPLAPGQTVRLAAEWTSWCRPRRDATVRVDAPGYAGSITRDVATPDCRPDTPSTLQLHDPSRGAHQRAETRVDATVDGAPPFSLEVGAVRPADEDTPPTHALTLTSEWHTPIGVALGDVTLELQCPGQAALPHNSGGTVGVLAPRQDTTATVSLAAQHGSLEPGSHAASLAVPFWRDVDPARPPSGAPDGIATVRLTYEVAPLRGRRGMHRG